MSRNWISALVSFFQMPTVPHKLDFLDGYRAVASLSVILSHFIEEFQLMDTDYKIFDKIGAIGIASFFSLSSFLLTYRVMSGYDNSKSNRECLLKTIQFAVRRFFRIYAPFAVFWTILYSLPKKWDSYIVSRPTIPYLEGLKLKNLIASHLWTVPVEVKYYFVIPFISYLAVKSGRHWYLFALLTASFVYVIEHFRLYNDKLSILYMIPTFLCGSISAMFIYNLKKHDRLAKFIKSESTQRILGMLCVILTFLDFRYGQRIKRLYFQNGSQYIRPVYITVITLPILVLSAPNLISNIYNNRFLRSYGRLSYGIYMFHYIVLGLILSIKHKFDITVEPLILAVIMSYGVGLVWAYTVENMFARISEFICIKIAKVPFFGVAHQTRQQQQQYMPIGMQDSRNTTSA